MVYEHVVWNLFVPTCRTSFALIGLQKMLGKLGLSFDGRPHSGLDDATNIARIVVELLKVCFYFKT